MKKNFLINGKFFIFFFLFIALIILKICETRKAKSHLYKEEEFPELTEEEIIRAKTNYLKEDDIDQKGFLEPIVNPEKFDLNMDEKISKQELKKAIIWMIYSKDPENKRKIKNILKDHVSNSVDVFINSLNFESFTYLQFGKFMNRINAPDFINEEIMINRHFVDKSEHREPAIDL